jgi:hypothetical protein
MPKLNYRYLYLMEVGDTVLIPINENRSILTIMGNTTMHGRKYDKKFKNCTVMQDNIINVKTQRIK